MSELDIERAAASVAGLVDEYTQRGWNDEGRAKFAAIILRRLKRFQTNSAPAEWRLVPVEPTEAMMLAAHRVSSRVMVFESRGIYDAMLSAAPAKSASGPVGEPPAALAVQPAWQDATHGYSVRQAQCPVCRGEGQLSDGYITTGFGDQPYYTGCENCGATGLITEPEAARPTGDSDEVPGKPHETGELEEHKALLSMLVTLERALSNAKLGEEMEALCAEARALITAETHRMPRPNPPAREP